MVNQGLKKKTKGKIYYLLNLGKNQMEQFAHTENQKIVKFSHQFRKTGVKAEFWSGDLLFHSNSSYLGAKIDASKA